MGPQYQPQVLTQAMGQPPQPEVQPPEAGWVNPGTAWVEEARRQAEAAQAEAQKARYSPEQVAQRKQRNQMEYEIGLLGMLSGNEQLGQVGGQVFKQSLAERTPHIGERGTTDQLTGEFKYNPAYLVEQRQGVLNKALEREATMQAARTSAEEMKAYREQRDRQDAQLRRESIAAANTRAGMQPQYVIDPTSGKVKIVTRGEAIAGGMTPGAAPSASAGQPGEDERKAYGWYQDVKLGFNVMEKAMATTPGVEKMSTREKLVRTATPQKVGDDLAYAMASPERQLFLTGVDKVTAAVLRAATGAGQNEQETLLALRAMMPRWGEAPEARQFKYKQIETYLDTLQRRAGRAMPQDGVTQAPASPQAPVVQPAGTLPPATAPQAPGAAPGALGRLQQRFAPTGGQ